MDGVAGGRDPDARAGGKLAKGERAVALNPAPRPRPGARRPAPRCELAGQLRRHRAGRRQSAPPLDRRPPVWRARRFPLGRKMAQAALLARGLGHLRRPARNRVEPAHFPLAALQRLRQRARLLVGEPPSPQSAQMARANPSRVERDFVPPIAVNKSNAVIGPSPRAATTSRSARLHVRRQGARLRCRASKARRLKNIAPPSTKPRGSALTRNSGCGRFSLSDQAAPTVVTNGLSSPKLGPFCFSGVSAARAFLCTERAGNSVLHGLATRFELALRNCRVHRLAGALVNEHSRFVKSRLLHPFPGCGLRTCA